MDEENDAISGATTTPLTIAEVRTKYEMWRTSKPHRYSAIPGELWDAALSLRDRHSICAIAKALRLNPSQLAERGRQRSDNHADSAARRNPFALAMPSVASPGFPSFVEVAYAPTTPPASFIPSQILEIRFPDGTRVSASQCDPVDVRTLFLDLLNGRR